MKILLIKIIKKQKTYSNLFKRSINNQSYSSKKTTTKNYIKRQKSNH